MINIYTKPKETKKTPFVNKPYYDDSIGEWGIVEEVNSKLNQVNVVTRRGIRLIGIPVFSQEWVVNKEDYVASSRNLPPVGASVFVLMPTKTATGAFVLCSGFPLCEPSLQNLFAKDDSELEEKNNTKETVTQGGWNITEEYETGIVNFVSKDENIKLSINSEEEVSLEIWDAVISVKEDELKISALENEITITSNGVTLKPKKLVIESEGDIEFKCSNSKLYTDNFVVKKSATSPIAALEVSP